MTCCYSGVHDYGGVVSQSSGVSTSHPVPGVTVPSADTLLIAAGIHLGSSGGTFHSYTSSIPGFTSRGSYQGFAFSQWWTPRTQMLDAPAGSPGAVGPWTATETGATSMLWIVLGVNPDEPERGVHIAPFFVPLGNQPAPV